MLYAGILNGLDSGGRAYVMNDEIESIMYCVWQVHQDDASPQDLVKQAALLVRQGRRAG